MQALLLNNNCSLCKYACWSSNLRNSLCCRRISW